jgi:hypothetical protein
MQSICPRSNAQTQPRAARNSVKAKLFNFIAFQFAWFACIIGAGYGVPWAGVFAVSFSAIAHIMITKQRSAWVFLLTVSLLLGFVLDGFVVFLGALSFPEHAALLTPVPLWMLFMWMNFATTIPLSLSWLKGRYILGALFGLIGGPGAYFTGMKLNAVQLGDNLTLSLLIIGVEWALATPLLVFIATKAESFSLPRQRQEPMKEGALP